MINYAGRLNQLSKKHAVNRGKPWSILDEVTVLCSFGEPILDVAEDLGRTYFATSSRRTIVRRRLRNGRSRCARR